MTPYKAQGYIALSLLLVVVVGVSTFALSSFNNAARPPAEVVKRQQAMAELERAKAELLAYAGNTHVIHGDRGPGYFPLSDGSGPCSAEDGLLPTQICDAQNDALYQFSISNEAIHVPLRYVVAPTLVYPAGRNAADRVQLPNSQPFVDGIAALLTYPGTEATFDDIVLPIRHEELMTSITPIIAHHVGQVLTAYRMQHRGGGFPETAEDLLEALDSAPTDGRDGPFSNRWNNGGWPGPPGRRLRRSPFRLAVPDYIPQWFFEENWLGSLTRYEQQGHEGTVSFTIAGCNGMHFTVQPQDGSISRTGSRCGN